MSVERFVERQKEYHEIALNELKKGRKRSHWMWFIFPQVLGFGSSSMTIYFEIKTHEEILEYIHNEYLMNNYLELCNVLLELKTNDPKDVFPHPDYLKLKSSLTLFYFATKNYTIRKVLDKFYDGELCESTIEILKLMN